MANNGVKICKVLSVDDPIGAGRIKVYINPDDNSVTSKISSKKEFIEALPYAFPLLPKMIHVMPKVGEEVFILSDDSDNSRRYYIGPIISQPQNMYYAEDGGAESSLQGSYDNPEESPYLNEGKKNFPYSVYPRKEDITIEGRKNCSIQMTDSELAIKNGVKQVVGEDNVSLNGDNTQSYILLKYNDKGFAKNSGSYYTDKSNNQVKSSVNVVGDKINLIGNKPSYKDNNSTFNVCNPESLITDSELASILEEAHQLPFGDKLVDFLKKFVYAFLNHTHPIGNVEPCVDSNVKTVKDYDLETLLSDNVRIN